MLACYALLDACKFARMSLDHAKVSLLQGGTRNWVCHRCDLRGFHCKVLVVVVDFKLMNSLSLLLLLLLVCCVDWEWVKKPTWVLYDQIRTWQHFPFQSFEETRRIYDQLGVFVCSFGLQELSQTPTRKFQQMDEKSKKLFRFGSQQLQHQSPEEARRSEEKEASKSMISL